MILSDKSILDAVDTGDIVIETFDRKQLGTNSYDVRLAPTLAWYEDIVLDARTVYGDEYAPPESNHARVMREDEEESRGEDAPAVGKVVYQEISREGIVLVPNRLYLGVTEEYVGSRKYVPWLDGKSSAGRLGISVHVTAGRGDVGFFNHWTMEIFVIQAVRVYAGMPLGQFTFFESAPVAVPYDQKPSAKYHGREKKPRPSAMWKNFR